MSERNLVAEGKQYHIACGKGDVGRYVFLPGDPGRVPKIAKYFDHAEKVAENREYVVYTGYLDGVKVSACSTGIGAPSAAIAMEELIEIGADTFIRVGKSGALQKELIPGSLVISTGAVRDDGTSPYYLPVEYPAVAHLDVVNALIHASKRLNMPHTFGIIQSKSAFYTEIRPETFPMVDEIVARWNAYQKAGVLVSEMEAAVLFTIADIKKVRAGCLVQVSDNQFAGEHLGKEISMDDAIKTGIEAVKIMIQQDIANK
ncbi:hypothetical protein CD30_05860 [Ureibacillus massiliensis 4400831 = CIP 108448 = CCUG 49529]|uniref:Nucleoside phosphorylase domain-containing protein n=1 Tax=Ureibacillus massiliensis 4400831 = CIP 108448 = CCUG 49529 TaxID=1211035 RepID=A0A0A3J363_9BACL|nr:nucleoside phosphorylase [Ureibacillus massiliensis]KGR91346.1 hypothetical protein CD30_05860 [Ureibacillus massiliensis 4400831 = CIP 108448 = CCUG 49529]